MWLAGALQTKNVWFVCLKREQLLANPFGRPQQTVLKTKKVWFAHSLETGLSEKKTTIFYKESHFELKGWFLEWKKKQLYY